jgi:acetolactate synthase I/II/III large subunit
VTVNDDGAFLLNAQELETAVPLEDTFVNVIWENRQYGSIVWKPERGPGRRDGGDLS